MSRANMIAHILLLIILANPKAAFTQPCMSAFHVVYGTEDGDESAHVLADFPQGNAFYVGGTKDNRSLIVKMSYTGNVLWSRTFDAAPSGRDNLGCLIADSDGNLVFGGIAGTPASGGILFIGKYDPVANALLWSKEIRTGWTRNYLFDILEKSPGGNYILSTNPHNDGASNNDAEFLEINRATGSVITNNSQLFSHGSSEQIAELIAYKGSLYGVGRYTHGGGAPGMRNAVVRLDEVSYDNIWTRMGHVGPNRDARLYGQDILAINDAIYTSYHGDPSGTSTSDNKIFVQKSDLDGNVTWVKQFEFPGGSESTVEMIESGGGIVMIAIMRNAPGNIMMMKMTPEGVITWAKSYQFPNISNIDFFTYSQHQLIEAGGYLIFAAYGQTSDAGREMLVVRADTEGNVSTPCVVVQPITVPVSLVSNPEFLEITPSTPTASLSQTNTLPSPGPGSIVSTRECLVADTVTGYVDTVICTGEVYEGYTMQGTYIDYFTTSQGCDSIRTLYLAFEDPVVTQIEHSICHGETFEGYSEHGMYVDTFDSASGCDSIRILNLNVGFIEQETEVHICFGESFGDYTLSGIYQDTLTSVEVPCDTLRTLYLFVHDAVHTTIDQAGCHGQSYEGYTQSGIFIDTLTAVTGCDSIRVLHLELQEEINSYHVLSVCDPANIYAGQPGIFTDTLVSLAGCDSILNLVIEGSRMFIPNIFSPNHDGFNDVFTVVVYPQLDVAVEYFAIFDRFGGMAYETSEWPVVWHGDDADGKPFQPGVFAYVFSYRCGGESVTEHGNITLVK